MKQMTTCTWHGIVPAVGHHEECEICFRDARMRAIEFEWKYIMGE